MKQHKILSAKEASNAAKNKRLERKRRLESFNTMNSIMKKINRAVSNGGNIITIDAVSKEVKAELESLGYTVTDLGQDFYSLNRQKRIIWIRWA